MRNDLNTKRKSGSESDDPQHIRHGLPLLELLVSQLQAAIADNNHTMLALTAAHTAIATTVQPIINRQRSKTSVKELLHEEMNRMVIALQGHDAFNQRLEHIINGLEALARQMANSQQRDEESGWDQLFSQISTSYTTAAERCIHTKVQRGESVGLCDTTDPESGSIELF